MSPDAVVDGLPYPVVIAADAAATLPGLIAPNCRAAVVVYDRQVEARAGAVAAALQAAGVDIRATIAIAGGESAKSAAAVAALYDAFLGSGADRATWVIAVGGGTITDVAGFAAATYMRGVPWAAVPTTVLGMADAAIGGKTGIDLPQGKNLIGAFWDPSAVVADLASLATLPARERSTGLAEAIKCAVVGDPPLLDLVASATAQAPSDVWKEIVRRAGAVKARIVAADPLERGRRAVLNLGHTVGHAIESASAYRVPHGEAVSVGLRAAGLIAKTHAGWERADHRRLLTALREAGLPLVVADASVDAVMSALAADKKSAGGQLRFVLPFKIGDVRHGIHVDRPTVRSAVEACLSPPSAAETG